MMTLAEAVRAERRRRGLTVTEASRHAGVSSSGWKAIEAGRRNGRRSEGLLRRWMAGSEGEQRRREERRRRMGP